MQESAESAQPHLEQHYSRLDRIVTMTRSHVAQVRAETDLPSMERAAAKHTPRGFRRALTERARSGPAIMAELKKASPSKGLIRADFHPAALAIELALAGAATLSVLTDEPFFQGSLDYLAAASAACPLPCLRKDFMVHEFQMLEARANCADAILLIVAVLTDPELKTLAASARSFELDILCEVHNAEELDRALDCGLGDAMLGVNNRNLHTFDTTLETSLQLIDSIPPTALPVTESGITTREDIAQLRAAGYQAFLIGESLMRAASPGDALRELLR